MVFKVTEDGVIKADTLCNFADIPTKATRIVGEKHQVRRLSMTSFVSRNVYLT